MISIIIPVLNESHTIERQLQCLHQIMDSDYEVIVVDGGSVDNTAALALPLSDHVITSKKQGRAAQMNAGAALAKGQVLLFLHSDTQLPNAIEKVLKPIAESQWGFFPVKLSGENLMFRVIEKMISWRSRLSSIATGDQSLFIGRQLFFDNAGYTEIPLMEDVELSKRLKKKSKPIVLSEAVITSSRRWEEKGILPTILLMWRLRFLYFIGVSPQKLAKQYY